MAETNTNFIDFVAVLSDVELIPPPPPANYSLTHGYAADSELKRIQYLTLKCNSEIQQSFNLRGDSPNLFIMGSGTVAAVVTSLLVAFIFMEFLTKPEIATRSLSPDKPGLKKHHLYWTVCNCSLIISIRPQSHVSAVFCSILFRPAKFLTRQKVFIRSL